MLDFLTLQTATTHPSIVSILYTVLLAFLLSSLVALTYEKTFRGLSYSRNFIQALILSSIAAATVMQAIGDNPLRGLGALGALAMIRYRTVFKDPRDIVFMFAAVGSGVACGVFGFGIAVVGTTGFCAVAVLLYFSPFGKVRYFDGLLRFSAENGSMQNTVFENIMKENCRTFALITLRETGLGNRIEYSYHIKLRSAGAKEDFMAKIMGLKTVKDVNLMLQETTVEM
jgi:hypothetical protein